MCLVQLDGHGSEHATPERVGAGATISPELGSLIESIEESRTISVNLEPAGEAKGMDVGRNDAAPNQSDQFRIYP
jgi:hypothetical protein